MLTASLSVALIGVSSSATFSALRFCCVLRYAFCKLCMCLRLLNAVWTCSSQLSFLYSFSMFRFGRKKLSREQRANRVAQKKASFMHKVKNQ